MTTTTEQQSFTKLTDLATPVKVLLKGASGTGKTTKLAWFPRPAILNFDNNLSSLRKVPQALRNDIRVYNPHIGQDGKPMPGHKMWTRALQLLDEMVDDPAIGTIAIDSFSALENCLENHVLATSAPHASLKKEQWGTYMRHLYWFVEELSALPDKHVVFTAHEEMSKDDLSGEILYTLLLTGKAKSNIDRYFTDTWRTYSKEVKDTVEFWVHTVPTSRVRSCKTSLALPNHFKWDDTADEIRTTLAEMLPTPSGS